MHSASSSALPALEGPLERLLAAVDGLATGTGAEFPVPFIVAGAHASGRRVLLRRVADYARGRGQKVFELEILPFGHDTPAQVLLRIAALAPDSPSAKTLSTIAASWSDRINAADAILDGAATRVQLVRFPAGPLASGERADRQLQQETLDVVRLVTRPRTGCLQVVAAQPWWRWPH